MAPKMLRSSSTGEVSSEMADLQMYLNRQFEMQTTLLEDLHRDVKALLESPGPNLFTFFDPENGVGTVSNTFPRQASNGSGVLPSLTSPVTIQQVSSSMSLPPRPTRDLEKPLGCPVPPPLTLPPDPVMPMMPATSDARPRQMHGQRSCRWTRIQRAIMRRGVEIQRSVIATPLSQETCWKSI